MYLYMCIEVLCSFSNMVAFLINIMYIYIYTKKRGPKIPFRLGRQDATSGETSPKVCGLPDADKGSRKNTIQHVRDVFYRE